MHLIVQIPCYNEAETLPLVLAELPRSLPGISRLEVLVIDDGSSDETVRVAQALGVDHILRLPRNMGLAAAFQAGLEYCLAAGADVVVNTDGDNQYPGRFIGDLIKPVLAGQADIVIGDRQTYQIAHFSPVKRLLQRWGSWVVRVASDTEVPDATSGFRALSREAALRLIVLTRYTYTLETIIQAGKKGLIVASVPITVHDPTRESRLMRSTWSYVKRSAATILRLYAFYEPLRTFSFLAAPFAASGTILLLRFFYFYLFSAQSGIGRLNQSVTIGSTLITVGFLIFLFGVIADISSTQRALMEEILYRQRKQELAEKKQTTTQAVEVVNEP
ncbi:MAG: glycosyltransferase family 2 protein [Caldilineaceae bacterium]|nr:glycosyltransferase family 2 protein [Caldilineaceae bacterium]